MSTTIFKGVDPEQENDMLRVVHGSQRILRGKDDGIIRIRFKYEGYIGHITIQASKISKDDQALILSSTGKDVSSTNMIMLAKPGERTFLEEWNGTPEKKKLAPSEYVLSTAPSSSSSSSPLSSSSSSLSGSFSPSTISGSSPSSSSSSSSSSPSTLKISKGGKGLFTDEVKIVQHEDWNEPEAGGTEIVSFDALGDILNPKASLDDLSKIGDMFGVTSFFALVKKLGAPRTVEQEMRENGAPSYIIAQALKMMKDYREKSTENTDVPDENLLALLAYTSDILYRDINKSLRVEGTASSVMDNINKWRSTIFNLIQCIRMIKPLRGKKVYRGLERPAETQFSQWTNLGSVVLFQAFTSASTDKSAARTFANMKENPVLLCIETTSGKPIPLSFYPSESEVIFRPFTSFRVKAVTVEKEPGKKDMTVIDLEEYHCDIRGRKVVVWIDDKMMDNNDKILQLGDKHGITIVPFKSTIDVCNFFRENKGLLHRDIKSFRIITDMARVEIPRGSDDKKEKLNIQAGKDLIKILEVEFYYKEKILVYTSKTNLAENIKKLEGTSGVAVCSQKECLQFALFKD